MAGDALRRRPAALIFDMDGLMLDTEPLAARAWVDAARDLGLAFDSTINHRLIGRNFPDCRTIIGEHHGAGYPVDDVKIALYDGSYHEVDSSEMAFKIAGSMAFKDAARKAAPVLLEPVMRVEVVVPEEYMGDIMGDLNSRRGRITAMEARAGTQIVRARVPLSEMFGYATDLRSRTQGRATYSMHFDRYEQAPQAVSEEVVARVTGR